MSARALMLQGTGSNVGKSLLLAGLCRAAKRRGIAVAPFKPQNMSNNAAVTAEGGEIGRAQALQARAAGLAPSVDMNPVLLKPQSDIGAQVIVRGRVAGSARAREYQDWRPRLMAEVLASFAQLGRRADLILVEGAGSPAEVNLRRGDIANMGFATRLGVPVVLVGDIDRGGVIASLVGTWHLLPGTERALVAGFLVNKFRGDPSLFDDGLAIIARETGWRPLGIVPWFADAVRLPAEDAVSLEEAVSLEDRAQTGARAIRIAVPMLSRIANFDDFDPLKTEPDVALDFVPPGRPLPGDADLVILPGTKATLADLGFLRAQGWDIDLAAHIRRGGRVLGVCGGFQMLGRRLADPGGIEGPPGETEGLGLLDIETGIAPEKTLRYARGAERESGLPVEGYEMHMGRTTGPGLARPFLTLEGKSEGALSADRRVAGCYLHGLFASDAFRHGFLARFRSRAASGLGHDAMVDATLDALARHLESHLDVERLLELAREVEGPVAHAPGTTRP